MSAILMVSMASCKKYERNVRSTEGVLSLEGFELQWDETLLTKAATAAPGTYSIFIKNASGASVLETTYAQIKSAGGKVTLPAGDYTLEARSTAEEVPVAEFDKPVYGVKESFSITAGETTSLGSLVCTLLQVKATVSYDDAFLAMVTGNGKATVTVNPAAPLDFDLTYSGGRATYTDKAGYYAVNESGNTTMNIVFSGSISGKSQKMVANLTGMICDGAKPSCALKLTSGVSTAILSALLAMEGKCVTSQEGIVDDDIDRSIHNLTAIGADAMCITDEMVLRIMTSKGC